MVKIRILSDNQILVGNAHKQMNDYWITKIKQRIANRITLLNHNIKNVEYLSKAYWYILGQSQELENFKEHLEEELNNLLESEKDEIMDRP